MISITSEMICYQPIFSLQRFFYYSDFSIHKMHFTSELPMLVTLLFLNENIKCGYTFSKLECDEYFGTKIILFFAFSAPPFSVGETLHVAYKKYKIKRKYLISLVENIRIFMSAEK